MTKDNDMPDEIFAYHHISDGGEKSIQVDREFFITHTKYIRADIVEHLETELLVCDKAMALQRREIKEVRELLHRIYNEEDGDFGMVQFLINKYRREKVMEGEK